MTATNAVQITFTGGETKVFHVSKVRYSLTPLAGNTPYAYDEHGLIMERAQVAEVRLVNADAAAPTRRAPQDRLPKQPRRRSAKPGRFDSVTRRLHNLRQVAERVNAGVVTVAQYLAEIGADSETIRRYASQVGKRAKALAAAKGIEPALSGLALVGHHLARVFAYDRADIEVLRAAVAGYGRVSHLLNGAS